MTGDPTPHTTAAGAVGYRQTGPVVVIGRGGLVRVVYSGGHFQRKASTKKGPFERSRERIGNRNPSVYRAKTDDRQTCWLHTPRQQVPKATDAFYDRGSTFPLFSF